MVAVATRFVYSLWFTGVDTQISYHHSLPKQCMMHQSPKTTSFIYSLERGKDDNLTTRLPLWSSSVEESILIDFNLNRAGLKILVLFWLSWFAGQSSFKYISQATFLRHSHEEWDISWRSRRFPFGSSFTLHSLKLRSLDRFLNHKGYILDRSSVEI